MNLKNLLGCSVVAAFMFVSPVKAAGPVVIEFFGQNGCGYDYNEQLQLHEFIRTGEDVILINCRTTDSSKIDYSGSKDEQKQEIEELKKGSLEEVGVPLFFHEFCTRKAEEYSIKKGEYARKILLTVINGRWVANRNDILPAIKLGATDNVAPIEVMRDGEVLHISMPEDLSLPKEGKALLSLFVYAPSTAIKVGEPQNIALKTNYVRDKIEHMLDGYKRLVPLEEGEKAPEIMEEPETEEPLTEEEYEEEYKKEIARRQKVEEAIRTTFLRPVAAMEKIGIWDGSKSQYDFSLSTILSENNLDPEKAGYVVILQEGDSDTAPIIGAGEIVPESEKMNKITQTPVSPDVPDIPEAPGTPD